MSLFALPAFGIIAVVVAIEAESFIALRWAAFHSFTPLARGSSASKSRRGSPFSNSRLRWSFLRVRCC
jgi:hypothetical protein